MSYAPIPAVFSHFFFGLYCSTVKLGLYVLGLVRTLGYNVLFVNHGHRQSENMYIFFFLIRRTEWGTKSDISYQFSLQEHFFALSLVLFFWSRACHPLSFNFDFNFPARFQARDALKVISPYEKRAMNDIQDGEASSVADHSREDVELVLPVRKIGFWIERTLVRTYLFFYFPWQYVITEFHRITYRKVVYKSHTWSEAALFPNWRCT